MKGADQNLQRTNTIILRPVDAKQSTEAISQYMAQYGEVERVAIVEGKFSV